MFLWFMVKLIVFVEGMIVVILFCLILINICVVMVLILGIIKFGLMFWMSCLSVVVFVIFKV